MKRREISVGSYSSIFVIKRLYDQGNLQKEESVLAYGSKGLRVYHGEEIQQ